MKSICSEEHQSLLRDSDEALHYFSWDKIWHEFLQMMPNLSKLLSIIVQDKMLLCLLISMMLKKRCSKMSLVQKVVSLFLYGHGCGKQVWNKTVSKNVIFI